jgi:hypothetical protein
MPWQHDDVFGIKVMTLHRRLSRGIYLAAHIPDGEFRVCSACCSGSDGAEFGQLHLQLIIFRNCRYNYIELYDMYDAGDV